MLVYRNSPKSLQWALTSLLGRVARPRRMGALDQLLVLMEETHAVLLRVVQVANVSVRQWVQGPPGRRANTA